MKTNSIPFSKLDSIFLSMCSLCSLFYGQNYLEHSVIRNTSKCLNIQERLFHIIFEPNRKCSTFAWVSFPELICQLYIDFLYDVLCVRLGWCVLWNSIGLVNSVCLFLHKLFHSKPNRIFSILAHLAFPQLIHTLYQLHTRCHIMASLSGYAMPSF